MVFSSILCLLKPCQVLFWSAKNNIALERSSIKCHLSRKPDKIVGMVVIVIKLCYLVLKLRQQFIVLMPSRAREHFARVVHNTTSLTARSWTSCYYEVHQPARQLKCWVFYYTYIWHVYGQWICDKPTRSRYKSNSVTSLPLGLSCNDLNVESIPEAPFTESKPVCAPEKIIPNSK